MLPKMQVSHWITFGRCESFRLPDQAIFTHRGSILREMFARNVCLSLEKRLPVAALNIFKLACVTTLISMPKLEVERNAFMKQT